MPEAPVDALDAHLPYVALDLGPDGVIDHGARHRGLLSEAARQIGGDVEFAARDMDLVVIGEPEGDDARVEPRDEGAQGEEIDGIGLFRQNFQCGHDMPPQTL